MKKLLAILLVGLIMLSFATCGTNDNPSGNKNNPSVSQSGEENNNSGGNTNSGKLSMDDINNDNWQKVIQDNFLGVTVNLPEGWTVSYTKSMGGVHVYFDCKTDADGVAAFLEGVFSELKKVAVGEIKYYGYGVFDDITYNSIDDLKDDSGWMLDKEFNVPVDANGSKKIYISYGVERGNDETTGEWYIKQVQIYLSQNGNWD